MVELFNEGQAVDVVNLQNRLKEKDVPPEVASLETLRDIITTVPTSANVRAYAGIVREIASYGGDISGLVPDVDTSPSSQPYTRVR